MPLLQVDRVANSKLALADHFMHVRTFVLDFLSSGERMWDTSPQSMMHNHE